MTGRQWETPASRQLAFGVELRSWRSKRELSLAGLSRLVHYSKGYLSKIENGDKPVAPDVARRCDEALEAGGALLALAAPVEQPRRVAIPAQVSVDQCPYRGLAAFEPGDARWFLGRERATAEVLARVTERLEDPGPVLVVGPSGVGKSSLLRDLGDEPGTLPLLAHALLTTWQHREGGRLTVAGYQLTGGIHAAVATTAERAYARLDLAGQNTARRVLPRLVQVGRNSGQTRRRIDPTSPRTLTLTPREQTLADITGDGQSNRRPPKTT